MLSVSDPRGTIVAIASSTPSLRGIVRIAGENALEILGKLSVQPFVHPTRPVRIAISLDLGAELGVLDSDAFVWPTARSYTGCPSVELHTIGSRPLLEAIVEAAIRAGAKPAGPGEFTMKAFLAGRIDLTQAEAVLGVIDASNQKQLDAALAQLAGNVSAPLKKARDRLLDLLADLEAGLDFVDEDISFIDESTLRVGLQEVRQAVQIASHKMKRERQSDSFHWIVLRGLPNAGKSSLLNALVGNDVAIVSEQAGTTRDIVWSESNVNGQRLRIADTAGIEYATNQISRASQQAAIEIQASASVVLYCVEASQVQCTSAVELDSVAPIIRVATKADQLDGPMIGMLRQSGWMVTSATHASGLEDLIARISLRLNEALEAEDGGVAATAARCTDAIERALSSLGTAIDWIDCNVGHELLAAEIRHTLQAISEVTGEIYTDDLLDRVFSRFCIGK